MAFGKKNKLEKETDKGILPHGSVTMLSAGTCVEGNLKLGGDVRIDGLVNGNIEGKKRVVIGEKGKVVGDVHCDFLELHGKVEGNVMSKQAVRLHATAVLKGDLHAPQFSVDMGATFIGISKGQQTLNSQEKRADEANPKK